MLGTRQSEGLWVISYVNEINLRRAALFRSLLKGKRRDDDLSRCFRLAVLASLLSHAFQPNVLQNMLLIPCITTLYIPRCQLFDLAFSTSTKSHPWTENVALTQNGGCSTYDLAWFRSMTKNKYSVATLYCCWGKFLKSIFCEAVIVFLQPKSSFWQE